MTFNRLLVVLNNAYTLLRHTTSDPSADPVDSPVDSSDPPEASVCTDRPDRPLSTPSLSTHAVAQCSLALPNPNQPNNVNTNEGAHGSVGSAEVLVVPDARAPAVPAAAPVPSTSPSPTTHHVSSSAGRRGDRCPGLGGVGGREPRGSRCEGYDEQGASGCAGWEATGGDAQSRPRQGNSQRYDRLHTHTLEGSLCVPIKAVSKASSGPHGRGAKG